MVSVQETLDSRINETESIIQECRNRIKQALEVESNQLKEKAEQESVRIIARAKEEAAQIAGESREKSAHVIDDTKNRAAQIITAIIENGMAPAQAEINRTAAEAKTRISQLLDQVSQSLEQIALEAEAQIKAEHDRLAALVTETETRLSSLNEMPYPEISVGPATITPEVASEVKVNQEPRSADTAVNETPSAPREKTQDARLYQECLTLEVVSPFGQEHQGGIPERLSRFNGLKIRSTSVYSRANRRITKYTLDLEQPLPLLKVLKAMPQVREITELKDNIVVVLK